MLRRVDYDGEDRLWWGVYYRGEERLWWGGKNVEENVERVVERVESVGIVDYGGEDIVECVIWAI